MATAAAFTSFLQKKVASLSTSEEAVTISASSDSRISAIQCVCASAWLASYTSGDSSGDMIPVAAGQAFTVLMRAGDVVIYPKLASGTATLVMYPAA